MTDLAEGPCLSSALRGGTRAGDLRRSFRAVLASTFTNRPNARSLVGEEGLAPTASCAQDRRSPPELFPVDVQITAMTRYS